MMDAIPKKGVNLFCDIVGDMLFETDKGMPILLFLIQNLDFGYSLELPGGSNVYPRHDLCFEHKLFF